MSKIKDFLRFFSRSTPFLLGNTLSFLPYLLFLNYSDGLTWRSLVPFVLFYTFRMTGIFLLRAMPTGVNSYTLLMIAILLGCGGSLVGTLGFMFPSFYKVAALALGLSAAWFLPAKLTVDQEEACAGYQTVKPAYMVGGMLLASVLFLTLSVGSVAGRTFSFAAYTIFYVASYHTVTHYPHFDLHFAGFRKRLLQAKQVGLFTGFLLLLVLLTLLPNVVASWESGLILMATCIIFVLLVLLTAPNSPQKRLPRGLVLLTGANGMVANFLFLFGSLYVSTVEGASQVPMRAFLPYILGMVLGLLLRPLLLARVGETRAPQLLLLGQVVGLLLFLLFPKISLGLAVVSLFRSMTTAWLNDVYQSQPTLPENQRLLAKFTLQHKGSLLHQGILLVMLSGLLLLKGLPQSALRILTTYTAASLQEKAVLEMAKDLNVAFLVIGLVALAIDWHRHPVTLTKPTAEQSSQEK